MTRSTDGTHLSLGLALGTGTILLGLNSSMIAVALVTIGADLHLDGPALAWAVSSLYLAAAVAAPVAGRLADAFGPRRVFLGGLALVLLASLAGTLVRDAATLIAVRVLLGVGASVHYPAAMAIIRRVSDQRGSSPAALIGVISVCGQTTAALGPAVGAVVVAAAGWRGIYWVNLPLVVVSAVLTLRAVPPLPVERRERGRALLRRTDLPGAALFVGALTAVMLTLTLLQLGSTWAWPLAVAVVAAVALWWWERRRPEPFLDVVELARNAPLRGVLARAVLTYFAFYTVFYGLPQWLESRGELSVVGAGTLMVPVFVAGALSTVAAAWWGGRVTPWLLLAAGGATFVAGGALLATVVDAGTSTVVLVAVAVVLGLPNGLNNIGNQLVLQDAVPAATAGSATGLYRTAQYVGASLSSLAVMFVMTGTSGAAEAATGLGAIVGGVGVLLVIWTTAVLARHRPGPLGRTP